jgi:hypothetical protein
LGSFLFTELAQSFGYFFPRQKLCIDFDENKIVGLHFGRSICFANSSGHTASEAEIEETANDEGLIHSQLRLLGHANQGCQIFLRSFYQSGGKYTK